MACKFIDGLCWGLLLIACNILQAIRKNNSNTLNREQPKSLHEESVCYRGFANLFLPLWRDHIDFKFFNKREF